MHTRRLALLMRLADFILANMERIVDRWEAFAATLVPAASHMGSFELRDHAQQILEAIATDLRTSQTREAQITKSLGLAPVIDNAPHTAAETHAILRAQRLRHQATGGGIPRTACERAAPVDR